MRTLEGIPLRTHTEEIEYAYLNSHIQRVIVTPDRETVFQIYRRGFSGYFVISLQPDMCGVYVTRDKTFKEKISGSGWERILNKYLSGSTVTKISQHGWDRIIKLSLTNLKLWGSHTSFSLYIELTGRNANCVLTTDQEREIILGAFRHIPATMNRYRTILPGKPYQLPPQKGHCTNPLDFAFKGPRESCVFSTEEDMVSWLVHEVDGVGPFLARVCVEKTKTGNDDALTSVNASAALKEIINPLQKKYYQVGLYRNPDDNKPLGIFWLETSIFPSGPSQTYSTMNHSIEMLHRESQHWLQSIQKKKKKKLFLQKELNYLHKERKKARELLIPTPELERLKTWGELLKIYSNLPNFREGPDSVTLTNLFSSDLETVTIPLDPTLDRVGNMQKYFRKYRKALNRNKYLQEKLGQLEKKRRNLLKNTTPYETTETNKEDIMQKYAHKKSSIVQFNTPLGNEILVGKNDHANHFLVSKIARKEDFWFHVRNLPGSHVVLKIISFHESIEPDIQRAARIAAQFSSARSSTKAEVIFTQVKHVRFIPGSGPGKVTFKREKTLFVRPGIAPELSRFQKKKN